MTKSNWYKSAQNNPEGVYRKKLNVDIPDECIRIMSDLLRRGYHSLIVGGFVRDSIVGLQSKDIDIEVYGTDYENLVEMLKSYGKVNLVGKAFGVVKLVDKDGQDYDFSPTRKDSKAPEDASQLGSGGGNRGRGIVTVVDPTLSPKEGARRRDFTFNSLGYDPLTEEMHDYYGGVDDIESGIMRATSDQFDEDPLRVLRGMQFASRFGFTLDPDTAEMAKTLKDVPLVQERVSEEWMKLFTKGKHPSKGLQYLVDTGWIDRYPELKSIVDVPQDPEWHPEGNLWEHTKYSLDAAAIIADREGLEDDDRAVLIAGVLGHDLGKPDTTLEEEKNGVSRITSKGHAEISGPLTKSFLQSIGINDKIIRRATPLARGHMMHLDYNSGSKKGNVRQIAEKIFPATIRELMYVIEADHSGRPPLSGGLPDEARGMSEDAQEENAYEGKVPHLILGRDILHYFDQPGPLVGETLKHVRDKQLSGLIHTKEQAMQTADNFLKGRLLPISGKDVLDAIGGPGGPHVGQILNDAWETFKSGVVVDQQWILDNYGQENVEIENMDKDASKYSDKNFNYKRAIKTYPNDDNRSAAEVTLNEFQYVNENHGLGLNQHRIDNALMKHNRDHEIGDSERLSFDDIIDFFKEDPVGAIEAYQGFVDEERAELDHSLGEESEEFLGDDRVAQFHSETKFGDVPDEINPKAGCPDYDELKKIWGESADIAMDYVYELEPHALDNIVFIGTTDDPEIAGVFEPKLTDAIEGGDDGSRQGVAFRLSPQKIESEVKEISKDVEDKNDIMKIRQLIIAEIIVHEAAHANGHNKEDVPLVKERSFLKKLIHCINETRNQHGEGPLPVTLKTENGND